MLFMLLRNSHRIVGLSLLSMTLLQVGCAGRDAHPVAVRQYGDINRSCAALESEIVFIEEEIRRLIPKTDKTGKNVALGVAGAFLLVPWFFMDLSQAEQIEIDAFRQRYNYLLGLAQDKNCTSNSRVPIPEFSNPGATQ
ncbi:hypothetical protein [Endozoicomonas sp. 8E]|uniref:hypothetical protein n=1 Tax=Endozoicomonas sp. 8E TaxID=3035692 RepID=UPI002939013D|nr:hypothetical protein [Endozoicomonas sp. 8E]WOG30045.1 hypothetical protein P6910_10435 [Endozoicomonas sp. 8E]